MKMRPNFWKGILIGFLLVILFRGSLYRTFISYDIISHRSFTGITDEHLVREIRAALAGREQPLSAEEIIHIGLRITERSLSFSTNAASNETNTVYQAGEANCVGYAALFAAIIEFISQEHQGTTMLATQQVAKLEFLGWDIHRFFGNHPFFRDHDFVEIRGPGSGEYYYVDPSVSDYLGIRRIKLKKSPKIDR